MRERDFEVVRARSAPSPDSGSGVVSLVDLRVREAFVDLDLAFPGLPQAGDEGRQRLALLEILALGGLAVFQLQQR